MNREGSTRKLVLCMVALAVAAASLAFAFAERRVPFPVPDDGKAYYGVQLDWQQDSVAGYADRMGAAPAVYGRYVNFPLRQDEEKAVGEEISALAAAHSAMMLTLEPRNGLASVTPEVLAEFS
jgi:hypothetical protein